MRVLIAALVLVATVRAGGQQTGPAAGATLFQQRCASCHNVEGRAPSLATGVVAHGSEDAQIAQTIRAGVPGTQMPPFPALSADEIRQLVTYIRSLSAGSANLTPKRTADRTAGPAAAHT